MNKTLFSMQVTLTIFALMVYFITGCGHQQESHETGEIRIRDPFILTDPSSGKYYMYAQMANRIDREHENQGVEVYISDDLWTWKGPEPVFVVPGDFWASNMVWAPEVHLYNDKYYLFVTFTSHDTLDMEKPAEFDNKHTLYKRGTQILKADSPLGPFVPFSNKAHTPAEWSALDGTLYVEDGVPYMVFCHEWTQIVDGSMELVQLSEDLSETTGEVVRLFRASEAGWVRPFRHHGYVTDGPFLYKTQSGKLLMGWSSFGEKGYAIGQAVSASGSIYGPWEQTNYLIFAENGGHGMLFHTFEGELMLAFHQPNPSPLERVQIYRVEEHNDRLVTIEHIMK